MAPAVQSTYSERISPPRAGTLAGQHDTARLLTGICETASPGIPFGRAVSQGTLSAEGCLLAGAATINFKGVSVRDITLPGDRAILDAYLPPDAMNVMESGDIWVAPGEAVLVRDPVFFNLTTGIFMKATAGGISLTAIPGAYFKTACGIGGFAILSIPQGGRTA